MTRGVVALAACALAAASEGAVPGAAAPRPPRGPAAAEAPPRSLSSEVFQMLSSFDRRLSVAYATYYYRLGTYWRRTGEAVVGAWLAVYGREVRRCFAFGLPAAAAGRALAAGGSEANQAAVTPL